MLIEGSQWAAAPAVVSKAIACLEAAPRRFATPREARKALQEASNAALIDPSVVPPGTDATALGASIKTWLI